MYKIVEEHMFTEETGEYTSYGVEYSENRLYIADVTMNKEKIHWFVNLLNIEMPEPVHLSDIIEDNVDDLIWGQIQNIQLPFHYYIEHIFDYFIFCNLSNTLILEYFVHKCDTFVI